jgi:hypothetical protein
MRSLFLLENFYVTGFCVADDYYFPDFNSHPVGRPLPSMGCVPPIEKQRLNQTWSFCLKMATSCTHIAQWCLWNKFIKAWVQSRLLISLGFLPFLLFSHVHPSFSLFFYFFPYFSINLCTLFLHSICMLLSFVHPFLSFLLCIYHSFLSFHIYFIPYFLFFFFSHLSLFFCLPNSFFLPFYLCLSSSFFLFFFILSLSPMLPSVFQYRQRKFTFLNVLCTHP